jgi:phage tail-like protein
MTAQEFKTQIFTTPEQWGSGLRYRIENLNGGGITLGSMPSFAQWIQEVSGIENPVGLAVDECGLLYFIDAATCRLYRYDHKTKMLEEISCIGGCGSDPGKFDNPKRLILDDFTLWVLDAGNRRIQGFSRENYQIKYIIKKYIKDDTECYIEEPVDIALDKQGHLYVIDKKPFFQKESFKYQIHKYDNNGQYINSFGETHLKEPVGLAIGRGNNLYVIDKNYNGFLTFTGEGQYIGSIGDFSKIPKDDDTPTEFRPSIISIDTKGNIFVVDEETGQIYQFDPDGSYIGKIIIPDFKGQIQGLATDLKGNLYASSDKGIAFLSTQDKFTKEKGFYYSKTQDSGILNCQWHRLALEADIPPKAIIEVYYYSSDDEGLKIRIDSVLSDSTKTIQKKASILDNEIDWTESPETFFSSEDRNLKGEIDKALSESKKSILSAKTDFKDKKAAPKRRNMLFREKTGRYHWLKLVLSTFDEQVRPSVTRMTVFYPRSSYLRYLPAVYQEHFGSKEFLERFLSIFETVFYDLETEISQVFKYFDADTAPQEFLTWLASWLNLALEEEWPEEKKREFIQQASLLYKLKGTPDGIRKFIEIYTEKTPIILEHSRIGKPMILSGKGIFRLGINSILMQTPVRGFRLGDDSILGRVALRDREEQSPEDPFLQLAHRFTVILDLSADELSRIETGLRRIIEEEKPAHTAYNLRVGREIGIGRDMYVGLNTILMLPLDRVLSS